jgi:hypothetical protein
LPHARSTAEKRIRRLAAGISGMDGQRGEALRKAAHDRQGRKREFLQFTVEDEAVFKMPWSATITYRRALGEWGEFVCAENTHEYYAGKNTAVPRADQPDF